MRLAATPALVVLLCVGLTGCSGDQGTEVARPEGASAASPSASPTVASPSASPTVGAFANTSVLLDSLRYGCAPNDDPAVFGTWSGDARGDLIVIDAAGQERGAIPAAPGPFMVRLAFRDLPDLPATGEVRFRDSEGRVLERETMRLYNEPRGFCG